MADSLPLIPEKGSVCTDVRPVLRQVFQDLNSLPPLPSGVVGAGHQECGDADDEKWLQTYTSECKELWHHEEELKEDHAKKLSHKPNRNIYKLRECTKQKKEKKLQCRRRLKSLAQEDAGKEDGDIWRSDKGIIGRKDLIPSLKQDAARDAQLWIKNILTRSSGDLSSLKIRGSKIHAPLTLTKELEEKLSNYSYSEGNLQLTPTPQTPPAPRPTVVAACVLAVPPQLEFVNFILGQTHSQTLKFVNISKMEIRLALRPPSRRELDIEITGPRGFTVTAGAAAEIKVHFKARSVRTLNDQIFVHASLGKSIVVPISCYMEPPLLNIILPTISPQALNCKPSSATAMHKESTEVLDLGARLLGDVHRANIVMKCSEAHASFFVITEEAWVSLCLNELSAQGSLVAPPFAMTPACWHGGGITSGTIWCQATGPGLQLVALKILASTAITRPLILIADALCFRPEHITIMAHEKNYDICSEDDPHCEYYVHLGTAFPNRSLSATVNLVNHSSVTYSYYWRMRPWGVCSCWADRLAAEGLPGEEFDDEELCDGAKHARAQDINTISADSPCRAVQVIPSRSKIAPRSTTTVSIQAPDVGGKLGIQRAVLILVLEDIPDESFPADYDPMIVKSKTVENEHIPGLEAKTIKKCEVVCAQLEVWWEVVPVQFVLNPPALYLPYSRRVKSTEFPVLAHQLYGEDYIPASWVLPPLMTVSRQPDLVHDSSFEATIKMTLPSLPNQFPETKVLEMVADKAECRSSIAVTYSCDTRHPKLTPARRWLGLVVPRERVHANLTVHNDTHQHICWWMTPYRWWGEREPSKVCEQREPCSTCHEITCSCSMLRPTRGALDNLHSTTVRYAVVAPDTDGVVASLIQVRRTLGDVCKTNSGAGCEARSALVAYRVLAPRVIMRVFECCAGDDCKKCQIDAGVKGHGSSMLRPARALVVGRRTCYKLRVTNLTPLPTSVKWEDPLEPETTLKILFLPKEKLIGKYETIEFRVILESLVVTDRRLYMRCARVAHAYKPLYLVIDAAISGLEVECQFPLGGAETRDAFVLMRRTQREKSPDQAEIPQKASEIFSYDDKMRILQRDNICHCSFKLVYIPPVKPLRPPEDDHHSIDFIYDPLPYTKICACDATPKPVLPEEPEPYCLQFRNVPLKTVCSLTVTLRNLSVLTGRWKTAVRNFPRVKKRCLSKDPWANDVQHPGVAIHCSPGHGILPSSGQAEICVQVYADSWGVYKDQLLINIETLEPIVLDVWIDVVAPPLQFAIKPLDHYTEDYPILWLSPSDNARTLRAMNTSRSNLQVHVYVIKEHEHIQDGLPFRLYLRMFDLPPPTCPCSDIPFDSPDYQSDSVDVSSITQSSLLVEMDTGIELFLTADHGKQDIEYYEVQPDLVEIEAGASIDFSVLLKTPPHYEVAPNSLLMLRILPLNYAGPGWCRPEPQPLLVRARQTPRQPMLQLSCCELTVRLCALTLPCDDVIRVRRHCHARNVGSGHLQLTAKVDSPWTLVSVPSKLHSECRCDGLKGTRSRSLPLDLPPRSSVEMCVEVCVETQAVWPPERPKCAPPNYAQIKAITKELVLYDEDNTLETLPLHLILEYPMLIVEPLSINFGVITDGEARKTYFTVKHTSKYETLNMMTKWSGAKGYSISPQHFILPPGAMEKVYIQYTARWSSAPVEGSVKVTVAVGAAWCRSYVTVRAEPTRSTDKHKTVHDFTDDTVLLPPKFANYKIN